VFNMRAAWPTDKKPKGIVGSAMAARKNDSGSAMGLTSQMVMETVEELLEEVQEEQEGFENLQAPFDKKGATYVLNQNSREPQMEEDEMVPLWKILDMVGADWTYSSKGWAAENYALFMADNELWEENVRLKASGVENIGAKYWLNTEWGHELFAVRAGLQKFNIDHKFEVKNIYEYYAKWIREGKLKVNSDWNKDLKIKFTVQDPCQIVRKSYGDPIAEDLRFIVKSIVGEENFIDMTPNRSNNYCCGGGGGFLQAGYKEERLEYGRLKDDQIKATGADYCIAGCHNCHAQIHELSEHYGGNYPVVHLWTMICLSLGILGPNEREYLGDDLKEVNVFHPETSMM
jgi:hypothetical protein